MALQTWLVIDSLNTGALLAWKLYTQSLLPPFQVIKRPTDGVLKLRLEQEE